jgi:Zn-dependent peptidase ImmA (M78 family)
LIITGQSCDNTTGKLKENYFTPGNDGITIGANGTDQVIVLNSSTSTETDKAVVLAHELTHTIRGEYSLEANNSIGGSNKNEEAYAIQMENKVRNELRYELRTDGDTSDDINNEGISDGYGT